MPKRRAKGEGSLYFSDASKLWVAQITLPNGKRITKYSKTQKVVKDWLVSQRSAIREGLWIEDGSLTVSTFFERFLNETIALSTKPKTHISYSSLIRNHVLPSLGHLKLTDLRPQHLQSLYAEKLESGLSKRTVQFTHSVIHRGLEQAVKWGLVPKNVAKLANPPKPEKKAPLTFSKEEAVILLEHLRGDRLYPLYAVAIGCGLRLGELLALKWEDINFDAGTISVKRNIQYIPHQGLVVGEPKSERSRRSVVMPEFVAGILKKQKGDGWVFKTSNNTPFSPRNIERHFVKILDKANLPHIRFHDLRHTAATLLLMEGVHPKVVQEMLGHSQIGITLDIYSHVLPSMQKEAADKMNNLFNGINSN